MTIKQIKSKKFKKFLYEVSQHSRVKTKELGSKLHLSQQSASYLFSSAFRQGLLLAPTVVIDPAKLGLINISVYYNFADFTTKSIQEVLTYLQRQDAVVSLEQLEEGYDIVCRYGVPNLSHFNKMNREFLQSFQHKIFVAEMFPIVVEHLYPKHYLVPHQQFSEIVISGDREMVQLSANELRLLSVLSKHPQSTIIELSRLLSLNPKTVIRIKTSLEKAKIIRGYSALWDYTTLGIRRRYILFSSHDVRLKDDVRFLELAKVHPNIVRFTRLIGAYDLLLDVEGENLNSRDVLTEFRSEFGFKTYRVIKSKALLKEIYIPRSVFDC